MYSDVVRRTRKQLLKINTREFGRLAGRSHTLVNRWERGLTPPDYELMFYLYMTTDNAVMGGMAAELMRELDAARASKDLERFTRPT